MIVRLLKGNTVTSKRVKNCYSEFSALLNVSVWRLCCFLSERHVLFTVEFIYYRAAITFLLPWRPSWYRRSGRQNHSLGLQVPIAFPITDVTPTNCLLDIYLNFWTHLPCPWNLEELKYIIYREVSWVHPEALHSAVAKLCVTSETVYIVEYMQM